MGLSILLAITVFAQCTPVRSIWDSRVKQDGCSLNLTIIATVMCGKPLPMPKNFSIPVKLL